MNQGEMRAVIGRVGAAALIGAIFTGCSNDLSRSEASDLIRERVASEAPGHFAKFPITVEIVELLVLDDHEREIRANVMFDYGEGADTVRDAAIVAVRSDRGWSVRAFDLRAAERIAIAGKDMLYEEYAAPLEVVARAMHPARQALAEVPEWEEVTRDDIATAIEGLRPDILEFVRSGEVEWGVEWGSIVRADMLWARSASDTALICAVAIRNESLGAPPEFLWTTEARSPRCRGGTYGWYEIETVERLRENLLVHGRMFP